MADLGGLAALDAEADLTICRGESTEKNSRQLPGLGKGHEIGRTARILHGSTRFGQSCPLVELRRR